MRQMVSGLVCCSWGFCHGSWAGAWSVRTVVVVPWVAGGHHAAAVPELSVGALWLQSVGGLEDGTH